MNSGGPDSLMCAIVTHKEYDLYSVYIDGGVPNKIRALPIAKRIADKYCVSHEVIDIGNRAIPELSYFNKSWQKSIFRKRHVGKERINVPFQGQVFKSLSAMYAMTIGIQTIVIGEDQHIKGKEQCDLFNHWSFNIVGLGNKINWILPLYNYNNIQIAELVKSDEELKDYTVSCDYKVACYDCIKCARKKSMGLKEELYV